MDNYFIEATEYTPKISLDCRQHVFEIRGNSYPENSAEFYQPVFAWLQEYFERLPPHLTINLEIIYFNSSSSKILLDFFDLLDEAVFRGSHVTVNWIYEEEDEDILEYGQEFQEDFNGLSFQFIEKQIPSF